jgi:lipoate-protein ligase A
VYYDFDNLSSSSVIKVCEVIVESLRYLGVDAKFEEPNNIMVDGKSIRLGRIYQKNTALCHGTLLMNANFKPQ